MNSSLRKIEFDDFIILDDTKFNTNTLKRARIVFENLKGEKKLSGLFDDAVWYCFSGVSGHYINFILQKKEYENHIGKLLHISYETMIVMLKTFAISLMNSLIFTTIKLKISNLKKFLEQHGDITTRKDEDYVVAVEEFLYFINTPSEMMDKILFEIPKAKTRKKQRRQLGPILVYLAINEEISRLFESEENCIDEKTFIELFPIYYWVKITFILPLRPTEMIVTPFNCITRSDDKVLLTFRRTLLKKHYKTVSYEVPKDYQSFSFTIPDSITVKNIEKYKTLTNAHKREYLFDYNERISVNNNFSLKSFNYLLERFVNEILNASPRYSFAKYATNIKMFPSVTAADSRHIALINMRQSGIKEYICQQLADHESIDITAGYYSNISEFIQHSSFMNMQREINQKRAVLNSCYNSTPISNSNQSCCTSPKRAVNKDDISDCIEQKHIQECIGCKYYYPSEKELSHYIEHEEKEIEIALDEFVKKLDQTKIKKKYDTDIDRVLLDLKTATSRYETGCFIKAQRMAQEWENKRSSQMNY